LVSLGDGREVRCHLVQPSPTGTEEVAQ